MADRSVVVRLRADVADFVRELDRATKATERVRDQTEETQTGATSAFGQMVRSADEHSDAWETTGATVAASGAVILGVVGAAVAAYAEFDKAMATVAADTRETGEALQSLREAAIAAGSATSFSAVDAAQAIDELAKAGVSTADILGGGLNGALALAAAGGLDVAEAAETAATAMVQFRLQGDQVGHVADLLAAGAGKAQGSVHDLGEGLKQGGLVASQFGISVEDTVGTLAAFASAGLVGSDAGTSFKTMLLALAKPSLEASAAMAKYNISAYDAQGNFVGLTALAGQLQAGLSGATQAQRDQALATIFGTDAIRSANVLYRQGADGLAEWIDRTDDAGYAAETAALKLDSLAGDWEYLMGSVDAAMLNSGATVNDWLRDVVQAAESVIDAYNALPESVQSGALAFGAVSGAALVAAGSFMVLLPSVLSTVAAFKTMATTNPIMAAGLGRVGVVALSAAAALAVFTVAGALANDGAKPEGVAKYVNVLSDLAQGADDAAPRLDALFESGTYAAGSFSEALKVTGGGLQGFMAKFDDVANFWHGSYLDDASASLGNMDKALATLVTSGAADTAAESFDRLSAEAAKQGITVDELMERFPQYAAAVDEAKAAADGAAPSASSLASAVTEIVPPTEDAAAAAESLADALDSMLAQFFSVDEAADAFASNLNKLADSAKQNGRELEGNTDKAIANREALRTTADSAAELIKKMAEQGATSEELSAKAADLKKQFLEQAEAAGFTGAQVDKVAAAYDAIPGIVETEIIAEGLDTMSTKLQGVIRQVEKIAGKTFTTTFVTKGDASGANNRVVAGGAIASANGNVLEFYANGGTRENHVAQIAPAGAMRVWAEPETGGEAYVPLAQEKRGRSKSIVEDVVGRFGGAVQWFADGGLTLAGQPRYTTGSTTDASAFAITTGSILSGLTASDSAPGAATAYAAALDAQAAAAARAAKAEDDLDVIRERAQRRLENMKAQFERNEEAAKDAADAEIEAAQGRVTALKRANDDALDAFKQRNDDELEALKARNEAELAALKAKSKNAAAIAALQARQDAAEKALARQQDDAEKAYARKLDDEETAANDAIAASKKANAKAAKELSDANDALYSRAKSNATKDEEAATTKLKAAKDADAAASKAAAEAERLLNEQRAKAAQLAESTANAVRKNATLTGALNDRAPAALANAGANLADASSAADAAARNVRDEAATAATTRRAAALADLASSATAYADAQRAMGVSEVTIGAGLDQVSAKIADLGARYGVGADAVGKLTAKLEAQRVSAASVLSSYNRQGALAAEFATSITALQAQGLSAGLLDQVIGGGTTDGLALARLLLAGGSSTIGAYNGSAATLDLYANAAGSQVAAARYGSGIYSPTYAGGGGVQSASLSPDAVAVLGQVVSAIASRPVSVTINGREVFLAMTDAAATAAYGAAG